jgi:hypothetical protein
VDADGEGKPGSAGAVRGVKRGRFTVTRLHRSGVDPHRVLLLGSRAMLGAHRQSHVEALGERIADRVWLRTRRGLDLDVLWELGPVLKAIRGGLASWRLWRYDAVVVVLASHSVGVIARWKSRRAERLLQGLLREVGTASHVLVVSLKDQGDSVDAAAGSASRTVDGVERGVADPAGTARVSSISVASDARDGADAVALQLLAPLNAADVAARGDAADAAHQRRLVPDDERRRQAAVDGLELRDRAVGRRLQHVLEKAQAAFDTTSAEITIIDRDRQWTMAASGTRREDMPRDTSLCNQSIEHPVPTLIADTWRVPTLQGNPLVAGPHAIRFYAAHPIESVDGYRIGVLCIWDNVPHAVDGFDIGALRDLALLAEAEIVSGRQTTPG